MTTRGARRGATCCTMTARAASAWARPPTGTSAMLTPAATTPGAGAAAGLGHGQGGNERESHRREDGQPPWEPACHASPPSPRSAHPSGADYRTAQREPRPTVARGRGGSGAGESCSSRRGRRRRRPPARGAAAGVRVAAHDPSPEGRALRAGLAHLHQQQAADVHGLRRREQRPRGRDVLRAGRHGVVVPTPESRHQAHAHGGAHGAPAGALRLAGRTGRSSRGPRSGRHRDQVDVQLPGDATGRVDHRQAARRGRERHAGIRGGQHDQAVAGALDHGRPRPVGRSGQVIRDPRSGRGPMFSEISTPHIGVPSTGLETPIGQSRRRGARCPNVAGPSIRMGGSGARRRPYGGSHDHVPPHEHPQDGHLRGAR